MATVNEPIHPLDKLFKRCQDIFQEYQLNTVSKFMKFILNYDELFEDRYDDDSVFFKWINNGISKEVKDKLKEHLLSHYDWSWDLSFLSDNHVEQLLMELSKTNSSSNSTNSKITSDEKRKNLNTLFRQAICEAIWGTYELPLTFDSQWLNKRNNFIGRKNDLINIEKNLLQSDHLVITGTAGIGKTYLAQQYVYSHNKYYEDYCIVTYQNNLETTIASIHFKEIQTTQFSSDKRFHIHWRHLLGKSRASILVIDNMTLDEQDFANNIKKLSDLPLQIIITTRCDYSEDLFKVHYTAALPENELIYLFKSKCKTDYPETSIKELINYLENNTLVVMLYASYLNKSKYSIKELLLERIHDYKSGPCFKAS